jgi:O-antigen ligase
MTGRAAPTVRLLLALALAALLPLIVVGEVRGTVGGITLHLRYLEAIRGLALVWLACQLWAPARTAAPYRPRPGDLPLALFAGAAVVSVTLGGGHWGSVRSLFGAIGLGLLASALFGPPSRRRLLLHYLGAAVLLVLLRELIAHPDLLPPRELARYGLATANANVLGFLFAMAGPLFLAETLAGRGAERAAPALYTAAAVLGVLLTFSRVAAFGLAFGVLVVAFLHARRAAALTVAAAAVLAFLAVQRPDLWTASRASGDADRLRIMATSLSLAAESPILGVGFGGNNLAAPFRARYLSRYGQPLFRYHSANQLVDLLVETGLVGTALALWWAWSLGRGAWHRLRTAHGTARLRAAGGAAALAAIAVMSLGEPPLDHGKLLPILFLLLAYTAPASDDGSDA